MIDLTTGTVTEGPAAVEAPQTPEEFAQQLNPDGSAFLLQKTLAAFAVVELQGLEVHHAATQGT